MIRAKTHTAYLSKTGHENLSTALEQLTRLWNQALRNRKRAWEESEETTSLCERFGWLTKLRQGQPFAWGGFGAVMQRSVLERQNRACDRFFQQGGYPRFKSRNWGMRGFETAPVGVHCNGALNWTEVKGIGIVRFKGAVEGDPKLIRMVRAARGVEWRYRAGSPWTA